MVDVSVPYFMCIYTTPVTQGQFLSGNKVDLNLKLFFPSLKLVMLPKLKNSVCATILSIAGVGRKNRFRPFRAGRQNLMLINKKKKRTYHLVHFAVLVDHEVKRKEKERQIVGPCQRNKNWEILW